MYREIWSILNCGHGRSSFGEEFVSIHEAISSTRLLTSFDICALRIPEFEPKVLPTSLATVSHGVPAVRFARISPPRFTASAIAGGTSGKICKNVNFVL